MKMFLLSLVFVAGTANAANIDCSKIKDQSITVDVSGVKELMPLLGEFYACMKHDKAVVGAMRSVSEKSVAGEQLCKFIDTKVIGLTSWASGRYSLYGEAGGDYKFLFLEPYYCSAVGTGLFEGVEDNARFEVWVTHSEKNLEMCAPRVCQGVKGFNRITFTLQVLN